MSFFRKDLEDKKPVRVDVPHAKIMMCLNESTLNPWDAVGLDFVELMQKIEINRYHSWVTEELTKELAEYCGVDRDMLIMGNGADEMLYYLFTAVNDKNGYAVSLSPSYFDYLSYCNAVGLEIRFVNYQEDFSFSTEEYLHAAGNNNCSLLILCNPNNPTGNLIPDEQIEAIIKANPNKIVLLDETYYEFSGKTWAKKLKQYPNLVIIRSFSKAFSAAGLRFGYMLSCPETIYNIKKVVTAFNLSIYTQAMAYTILRKRYIFLKHNQHVITERNRMQEELKRIRGIKTFSTETNFLLFHCINSIDLFEYLLKNEIAIRNVGKTAILRDCLRVTAGREDENNRLIKLVRDYNYEKI